MSTGQDSGSHTDRLSSVNKMFMIWKKNGQCTNGDESNLILPKFARPLDENSQGFCILVCNFFSAKHLTGLDAGLDGKISANQIPGVFLLQRAHPMASSWSHDI